jgi:REP element-mobilizing transposase RayT
MPRANRFFIPGTVWHITHRCHDRKFLLKFDRDRRRWKHWLFQSRKRYGLSVLNYIATSNHIHLLLMANEDTAIARALQLVAGRTAQEYNQRKGRKGAFWEDRYFATAICTDSHLARCLVYIDLNMVRAGAVSHPSQWHVSGYNEIQNTPQRYRIIDRAAVCELFEQSSWRQFQLSHQNLVQAALEQGIPRRESIWTEPIAVGTRQFVADIKSQLGSKAYHRNEESVSRGSCMLKDGTA